MEKCTSPFTEKGFSSKTRKEIGVKKVLMVPCIVTAVLCVGGIHAAVPVVSDIEMSQDNQAMRRVTVSYSLSVEAIVTVDFQTNVLEDASGEWVSIGAENFRTVTGDVNRIVAVTKENERRMIVWDARAEWPDVRIREPRFRAKITAWPTNSPPDYMVIDLRPAQSYPVNYYVSENALPYGAVTNKIYKDELLVLRRIRAKGIVWLRGASEQMKNWYNTSSSGVWTDELSQSYVQHPVMLTRDYYIGVYEVTEGQFYRVMGGEQPSSPRFPIRTYYSSNGNRKACFRGGDGMNWPTFTSGEFDYDKSHEVTPQSFFGLIRARAEVKGVYDMPTDAQWEYACRAGTDEPVPVRLDKTNLTDIYENMCRYNENAKTSDCEGVEGNTLATVGSYEPNPWGLYDMLGNCYEFVLDHYTDEHFASYDPDKVLVDPYGSDQPRAYFCTRGGHATQKPLSVNSVTCGQSAAGDGYGGDTYWGTRVTMDIQ